MVSLDHLKHDFFLKKSFLVLSKKFQIELNRSFLLLYSPLDQAEELKTLRCVFCDVVSLSFEYFNVLIFKQNFQKIVRKSH
jgi:hypothetical protein